jgi:uncharacterized iron-regulated protein
MGLRMIMLATVLSAAACGGAARGPAAPAVRGIEAAALPYRILSARGGAEVPEADAIAALARARAVCIGEHHPNPHDHWAQLHLLGKLLEHHRASGARTGLGMEMFQRPFQGVLDDFAAGTIDEAALQSRTGWAERWGYDFSLYGPILRLAVKAGGSLVALNTPRELTKKVSRQGIESLTEAERGELPELVLDDADHRAWWDAIMGAMGGAHGHARAEGGGGEKEAGTGTGEGTGTEDEQSAGMPSAERIYTAQVLWDETMAEVAATWLAADGRRRMVILAGSGHCHESAIVRRLERRGAGEVMSIRPLIDKGDGEVARLVARPENDYLFVMSRE